MATASLVPVSLTDADANVAAGAFTDIDNTIASASGTTLDSVVDRWTNQADNTTNGNFSFGITNTPGDYDSFTSIQLTVRARVTAPAGIDDTTTYRLDISGTNAPTDTIEFTDADVGSGFINRNFTNSSVTPSQADIDGWTVRCYQWLYSKTKGADTLNIEIDEIEAVLTYTAGATVNNVTKTDTLDGLVNDSDLQLRERNRLNQETSDVTDAQAIQRYRDRLQTDSATATDSAIATYVPAATISNVTKTDSIKVEDLLITTSPLDHYSRATRYRNRSQTETTDLTDTFAALRERNRANSDSITVEDVSVELRESNNEIIETIDINDDGIELRQRYRLNQETITVTDNAIATYVPTGATVYEVTVTSTIDVVDSQISLRLRDRGQNESIDIADFEVYSKEARRGTSDSFNVEDVKTSYIENDEGVSETVDTTDDSIELRNRNRLASESATVTDNAIPTYVPAGSTINNVSLSDSITVADANEELRERSRINFDEFSTSDNQTQQITNIRVLTDNIDIVDSLQALRLRKVQKTDSVDLTETAESIRERIRALNDSADVVDFNTAIIVSPGVSSVTVTDQISLSDSIQSSITYPNLDFRIKHGLSLLAVEHGVEHENILIGLKEETS